MGRTVETRMDHRAVLRRGRPVNHIPHPVLCVQTSGPWAIIWPYLAVTGGVRREMVSVDGWGNSSVHPL